MDIQIGPFLKNLRLSCGYSLRKAAKKTNLSHGYIRDVELGSNRSLGSEIIPMPQTLKKFADAYDISYNELMRIAGHTHTKSEINFEFLEIDLNTILFVEVDKNNHIVYHNQFSCFIENKALNDYILLEDILEDRGFLRLHSGLFANLNMVKAFDINSGKVYFSEEMEGKCLDMGSVRSTNTKRILIRSISKNNNRSGIDLINHNPFYTLIRNIVT